MAFLCFEPEVAYITSVTAYWPELAVIPLAPRFGKCSLSCAQWGGEQVLLSNG